MNRRFLGTLSAAVISAAIAVPAIVPAASQAPTREDVTNDFINALTVVEENYAAEVDYDQVSKSAIHGMLRALDPHSSYYDFDEFEEFKTDQQSQYFGIGATIGQRARKVYILAPFQNTPAERAGLRYGDEIVEIDGQSTAGWPSPKVSTAMRGPRGTKVNIKVLRPGVAEPIAVTIVRDAVPLPTVTNAYMVAPGVGYIHQQRGFNFTSSKEVVEAIARLKADGMTTLIFDLRGNPGGLVKEAVTLANQFLSKGQSILVIKGRSGPMQSREYQAWNESPDDFPMVVLIDGGSASASEIVAGALQDHDRALIVGDTSFGKGLVQSPFELEKEGGGLILTTAKYYTPSGRLIQRDYSNLSIYDYYLNRGERKADKAKAFQTDAGRTIYGGGGISPDVTVTRPPDTTKKIVKWMDSTFLFTRLAINGQVKGFESFAFSKLTSEHVLKPTEFVVTDAYVAEFKRFLAAHPDLKLSAAEVDADRDFVRQQLRFEIATAHHGLETANQVTALTDPQLQRAIAEVPVAGKMAEAYRRQRLAANTAPRAGGSKPN